MLQFTAQVQVVRAALANRNPVRCAVYVVVCLQRRILPHKVCALNQDIRRSERNAVAAQRVYCKKANVSGRVFDRLYRLGGAVEHGKFNINAESPCKATRQVHRHAHRCARTHIPMGQNGVAHVNGGAQLARGGKNMHQGGRQRHGESFFNPSSTLLQQIFRAAPA